MASDNPFVGTERLGEEIKKRRLTAAVQPDDADAVAKVDG